VGSLSRKRYTYTQYVEPNRTGHCGNKSETERRPRCQNLALVLVPVVSCCLPVTRIWQLLFLHYCDNAKLKWQFLLLEVPQSAERWIAVR
jgi:hypothetical protein